jgi:hypothetical protein
MAILDDLKKNLEWQKLLMLFASISALTGILIIVFSNGFQPRIIPIRVELNRAEEERRLAEMSRFEDAQKEQQDIQTQLLATQEGLHELLKAQTPDSATLRAFSSRLSILEKRVLSFSEDQEALTKLLGDDPAKKMSMVVLSHDVAELKSDDAKDMASLQDRYKADIAAVREENKSQFDFVKWAVVFVGVSNLAGPFIALFKRNKSSTVDTIDAD